MTCGLRERVSCVAMPRSAKDLRYAYAHTLECAWGLPDPDAAPPPTGPMSVSELFSALIPSDDEEDARPLSPPLQSRDYDLAPSSASSDEEEEAPAAKRARNAAEQRAARSEAIRQGLLAQHAQVRARLEALREEDPGVVVPPPARPEATSKELQAQILKLQKRAAYKPPDRAAEEWGKLEPSQLAGAPLTLSGRWGSGAALVGTPVPEGGWLVCDLFSSIGGFSSGARALGHKVALAIDMDGDQLKVHAHNHPEARHVQLELGSKNEEAVLQLIDEAVPASERHRLWLHGSPPCTSQSNMSTWAWQRQSKESRHLTLSRTKHDRSPSARDSTSAASTTRLCATTKALA